MAVLKNPSKNLYELLLFVLALCALLWPAMDNGFPLLYSDSGTYIISGANNEIPVDRPIIYGLFVRHVGMSYSLWFVIVAQAALVLFTVHVLTRHFLRGSSIPVTALLVISLSFTTGLSTYTSQIMPDIFCGLVIVAFGLWVVRSKFHWRAVPLMILFALLVITHLSNLLVLFILAASTLTLILFRQLHKVRALHVLILVLTPLVGILFINHSYTGKYQLSKAGNAFITARLVETGAMEAYLKDHCPSEELSLCTYRSEFPDQAHVFLWNENSPIYEGGCKEKGWGHCWTSKNEEFGKISRAIYTNPEYLRMVLPVLAEGFFKQLMTFEIGLLVPLREGSPVHGPIVKEFDEEVIKDYKSADQYDHQLSFKTMSSIQFWVVWLSLPLVILSLVSPKLFNLSQKQRIVLRLILTGIIANALVVDVFSNVVDRYQARIIWLIPMMASILMVRFSSMGKPKKACDRFRKRLARPFRRNT